MWTGNSLVHTLANYTREDVVPSYKVIFPFEANFDPVPAQKFFYGHRITTVWLSIVYVAAVFGGQHLMRSKTEFRLRNALVVWNAALALFSIVGTLRSLPELAHVVAYKGFGYSVCIPSFFEDDSVAGFWTVMFAMSKVPELLDTAFIVLRKRPLIFLHWYHHITVLMYTWYAVSCVIGTGRWFITMNYIVHSVMYSYYAFRAKGIRIPKFVSMVITALQILQMVIGCVVNGVAYKIRFIDGIEACRISSTDVLSSLLLYASYLYLFASFFRESYFKKSSRKTE